ncbi:GNAT family N-acetyltransferase [Micromonospora arborensis]|uniref:GNAT family N-acetyltransferase n=1 Tax=Micromonospora arborensis TaxID=2116518 RepID=UPI0033C0B740
MTVTYTAHDSSDATPLIGDLGRLYAVVYAEPPYNEGLADTIRFMDGLYTEIERPGFTLITATDQGELVGAAYGWTMPAGKWWSRADTDPPAEVLTADKLAIMEWLVAPNRRGEGIGAELMRRLLTGRAERYATLASNPKAPARRMYARAGWRQVGKSHMPDGTPMDLLLLALPVR